MKKIVIIAALVLAFTGCQSDDGTSPVITDPVTIEFTQVAKNELYGDGEENIEGGIQIINSDNEWQALLQKITAVNVLPENFGDTNINFSEFTVIAAFDDLQMSGGRYITITSVVKTNEALIVTADNTMEEPDGALVITQPYHIIKIPKTTLPVISQ